MKEESGDAQGFEPDLRNAQEELKELMNEALGKKTAPWDIKRERPGFIKASTMCVKEFCKNNPLGRKLIILCKIWGYSRPKDTEFKAKSTTLELLAIYSFKQNPLLVSLCDYFNAFLDIIVNYGSIKAIFSNYFSDWEQNEHIMNVLNHPGPIITDPGFIFNSYEKFEWEGLKNHAKKTLDRIKDSTKLVRLSSVSMI